MKKRVERKEHHNIGTHKERMAKREAVRALRVVTIHVRWTSKYSPPEEDRKHRRQHSEGNVLV